MPPVRWKTVGASVAGFSHQVEGTECQDYFTSLTVAEGWLLAALSDGAGSARRGAEGAKAICDGVTAHLDKQLSNCKKNGHDVIEEFDVRLWVTDSIEVVRGRLIQNDPESSLAEFNATLVGVIAGPKGGWFFHIGDGAGCATESKMFSLSVLSPPENGEYANETYFFTQSNWLEHLRLTHFDHQFDLVCVMSDGVTPFALSPGSSGPYGPFFKPLSEYLANHTSEEGQRALTETFQKDALRRITGDDKTLFWALRAASINE